MQKADFVLPPAQTDFESQDAKVAFINQSMDVCQKATQAGDHYWNQLIYEKAQANYILSLDGYMALVKITKDDPNYQAYLQQQMKYIFAQVNSFMMLIVCRLKDAKLKFRISSQISKWLGILKRVTDRTSKIRCRRSLEPELSIIPTRQPKTL